MLRLCEERKTLWCIQRLCSCRTSARKGSIRETRHGHCLDGYNEMFRSLRNILQNRLRLTKCFNKLAQDSD